MLLLAAAAVVVLLLLVLVLMVVPQHPPAGHHAACAASASTKLLPQLQTPQCPRPPKHTPSCQPGTTRPSSLLPPPPPSPWLSPPRWSLIPVVRCGGQPHSSGGQGERRGRRRRGRHRGDGGRHRRRRRHRVCVYWCGCATFSKKERVTSEPENEFKGRVWNVRMCE